MVSLGFESSRGDRSTLDGSDGMAQSVKKLLKQALDQLPDDATVEEAMERLLFLSKIEVGIAEADAGKTLSHEEVRKRLGL
jgi:predicted transcriptional regulator